MEKKYKAEEEGHWSPRITVMQPSVENVSNVPAVERVMEGNLCMNGNPVKYKDCEDYNTDFCRRECSFGIKEIPVDDVDLDYQDESGK
jgi:hypothetical protein